MICQKRMPFQRQTGDGYKTLEADFIWFQSISCLPQTMNMESLNDGSGISNTLRLVLTLHVGISLAAVSLNIQPDPPGHRTHRSPTGPRPTCLEALTDPLNVC
jgi:hypothetical protein